jgi:hypothetical protein
MTLATSGQLKFSDIRAEHDPTSSGQIRISNYYAGNLIRSNTGGTNGAVPSSGALSFSKFYGTNLNQYFMYLFVTGGTATNLTGGEARSGMHIINNRMSIMGIYSYLNSNNNSYIQVQSVSSGAVIAARRSGSQGGGGAGEGGQYQDGSGNFYYQNWTYDGIDFLTSIFKYDSTLSTSSWARTFSSGFYSYGPSLYIPAGNIARNSLHVAASGNLYVTGRTTASYTDNHAAKLMKLTAAPAVSWGRTFTVGTTPNFDCISAGTDSSENVYTVVHGAGNGGTYFGVFKFDTAGTLQWQKIYRNTVFPDSGVYANGIHVTPGGDSYVHGYYNDSVTSKNTAVISKFDTAGTLQWQRKIEDANAETTCFDVSVDSDNNVYAALHHNSYSISGAATLWVKIDSNGNLLLSRYFRLAGTFSARYPSISIDSLNDVHVQFTNFNTAVSQRNLVLFKIPNDGSKTGTYSIVLSAQTSISVTYAAATSVSVASGATIAVAPGSWTVATDNAATLDVLNPISAPQFLHPNTIPQGTEGYFTSTTVRIY